MIHISCGLHKLLHTVLFCHGISMQTVSPSAGKESPVWKMIENLQKGMSWHWTKPFLMFETRYIQATSLGLPLEISKYYNTVTTITVNGKH